MITYIFLLRKNIIDNRTGDKEFTHVIEEFESFSCSCSWGVDLENLKLNIWKFYVTRINSHSPAAHPNE